VDPEDSKEEWGPGRWQCEGGRTISEMPSPAVEVPAKRRQCRKMDSFGSEPIALDHEVMRFHSYEIRCGGSHHQGVEKVIGQAGIVGESTAG